MTVHMTTEWVLEASRQRGFLSQKLFAIFSTPAADYGPIDDATDDHLAHQLAIEAEGKLFAAGPLCTEDGLSFEGDGMIIVRAGSMDEAREIADRDPMHRSGARTYRIRPWIMNEGAISLTVHLSDQTVQIR